MNKVITISIFLILITLPGLLPFFNQKFFYTQDYIFIARLHQISKAVEDGHFPMRWAQDFRFGEPTFNFYAALPYYLGASIRFWGINFIWVAKILFILSTTLSALTMYIFSKKLFGFKGALLSTVLYTYAPYRAVDMYVRGALSEAWAFVFFPLIFYASLLLSEKVNFFKISLLALSLAGLFLTHNVTTLMFLPFLFLWWFYLILSGKRWKSLLPFLISFVLGLGISAFFLLPALLERQFIQTKYLIVGYFDFRAHFVAFKQFFSTFWGYGSSLWGPIDGLSFQVGLVNWAAVVLSVIFGFIHRKDKKFLLLISFLGISFLFSLFLQHNKSAFIWEAIPLMAFIQFPWRFLAISIFLVSIMGGAVAEKLQNKWRVVYFVLIALSIITAFQYFRPKEYVDDKFFDKFLNVDSMRNGVDLTKDYLPVWVENPDGVYFKIPKAKIGEIEVSDLKRKTTSLDASVKVLEKSVIEIPITYFPGWEVKVNGNIASWFSPSKQGLIRLDLPKGEYQVKAEFKDTPIRTAGNLISLVSLVIASSLFVYKKSKL